MKTIAIRYIGKKTSETDHLYGSGLTWSPNQVHAVPVKIAAMLLSHPDVYEDARSAAAQKKQPVEPTKPEMARMDKDEKDQLPPANLAYMTKEQMAQYVSRNFNEKIDPAKYTRPALVAKVMDTMRERG